MRWLILFLLLPIVVSWAPGPAWARTVYPDLDLPETINARGRVLEVLSTDIQDTGYGLVTERQLLRVAITSGRYRGETVVVEHFKSGHPVYDVSVSAGDGVLLLLQVEGGRLGPVFIEAPLRQPQLVWLALGFILALVAAGGKKGLKAVLSLALMVLVVVKVLLPLLLKGFSPIPLTVLVAVVVSAVVLMAIGGPTRKTLVATIGTTGGVTAAGLLAMKVGAAARLTGLSAEEAQMLLFIPQGTDFDFRGLLFAGIIIGALGAVMDVGMSVASAMAELKRVDPAASPRQLFTSGMNVGRDVMGTMSNTLILAYTGGAIPLMLLFMAYDTPLTYIVNLDLIATEVVRALSGSIGLVLAIPITALAGAYVLTWEQGKRPHQGAKGSPPQVPKPQGELLASKRPVER